MGRKQRNRKRPFQQGPRAKVEVLDQKKQKPVILLGRHLTYVYANGAIFRFRRGTIDHLIGGRPAECARPPGGGGVRYISRILQICI